jgi:hypothetical protein
MSEKKPISNELDIRLITNPEALGLSEKKLLRRIEPILDELLEELKANGKIETFFTESEIEHANSITENLYAIGTNTNLFIHTGENVSKAQRFVSAVSEFGFTDSNIIHLYIEASALLLLQDFECFKTLLLFHLRDVDFRAHKFNETMQRFAPKAWEKLKPELDSRFRNSVAHGLWAIENKKIVLFEDAKLIPFEKLDFAQFVIRVKRQNVIFSCFMNLLYKKAMKGFLRADGSSQAVEDYNRNP